MVARAHDMYHDTSNHPSGPSRQTQQHLGQRQPSRHFDIYGTMPPPSLYPTEEHPAPNFMPRFSDNRMNATIGPNYPGYDAWGGISFGNHQGNSHAALGGTTRRNPLQGNRNNARAGLPSSWMDPPPMPGMPSFGGIDHTFDHAGRMDNNNNNSHDTDEDLIPTAIVIKNIPFAVKKEQLVSVMTDMGLPLPYAFNYHFDQGVFRGLAFANFTTAEETACVINSLNHYDLAGRKLRVEYKKMLPLAERERIEREKRIKRGQLEEQHRPLGNAHLQTQASLSSLSSQLPANSPSPVSSRPRVPGFPQQAQQPQPPQQQLNPLDPRSFPQDVDFNDPAVLSIYSDLIVFKNGKDDEMSFPANLTPPQRRMVHTLAHNLRLAHASRGTGDQRAVHVYRYPEQAQLSPTGVLPSHSLDPHRRALNRAATTDFSDVRGEGFSNGPTVARQTSGLLNGLPESINGLSAAHNLRAAKSYADLRSYTPSPVPSTASFPTNLTNNIARFTEFGTGSTGASATNLNATSISARDENLLANGLGSINLNSGFGAGGSPRNTRSAWDRDAPGPIGGHRAFTTTASLEEMTQHRGLPTRQPRGPAPERGPGFVRRNDTRPSGHNNSRGSDEAASQNQVEVLADL